MRYERGAKLADDRYEILSVPSKSPSQNRNAATVSYLGKDCWYADRLVRIRHVRYSNLERQAGDDGIRQGRSRFTRQIDLLNRLDAVVFPEPLDWFQDRNRDDFFTDPALADSEPVAVNQHLAGNDLGALIEKRYFLPMDDQPEPSVPDFRVHGPRTSRFFRRVTAHLRALVSARVVHVDLSPAHVFMLPTDEVPRLLGAGHLVSIDREGCIEDDEPSLRYTSSGFVAPELVDARRSWGHRASGEAVMLYGLGATLLQVLGGRKFDTAGTWKEGGHRGVMNAVETLRREIRGDRGDRHPRFALGRLDLLFVAERLLSEDPERRLQRINLKRAERLFDEISGDSRELRCDRCGTSFAGDRDNSLFTYADRRFTLCPLDAAWARESVQKRALCGPRHTFVEKQGMDWAREQIGHQPRSTCDTCRSKDAQS